MHYEANLIRFLFALFIRVVIPHPLHYGFKKSRLFCGRGFGILERVIFVLAVISFIGCGVPGAPLPPSADIPRLVGDLKAERKGTTVTLTWTIPTETTDGGLVRKSGKMLVQRALSTGPNSDLQFQTISELPLPPALKEGRGEQATAQDSLSDLLRSSNADFAVYLVLAQNRNGKSFGLPNRASVPLVPTLSPPQKISATPEPSGVMIRWEDGGPVQNNSRLQARYAFNIMRREQGANDAVLVKQVDAGNGAMNFLDPGIEWEKTYQYWISPVTLWQDRSRKGEVEGEDSPLVDVFAHDSFPPAPPSGLQAVFSAAPQNPFIDLTWTANTEPDLAGYNVYRHSGNQPPVKINSELVKTPRFPDPGIQPGGKYSYSVTAVDLRGNESGKSEETSETVPKN